MPDRVRAKLRSLPWMDDAAIAALEEDSARRIRDRDRRAA
jgi:hypothetical protein